MGIFQRHSPQYYRNKKDTYNRKYQRKYPVKTKIWRERSTSRLFISKEASLDDIKAIEKLLSQRSKDLKNAKK